MGNYIICEYSLGVIFIKGYIYKITNNINGKIYIGFTSRTIDIRFYEHKTASRYENKKYKNDKSRITYLYRAMNKYGEENFSVETLYEIEEGEDEVLLEQYFISLYDSQNKKVGYNIDKGGGAPPTLYGEKNHMTKLSDEEVAQITEELKKSSESMSSIAKRFGVHEDTIYRINSGIFRHNAEETYPLRNYNPLEERVKLIIEDLLHTDLKIKEIAEKYGMCYENISEINNGKTFKHLTNGMTFPLKVAKHESKLSVETQEHIIEDIKQGFSTSEISKKYKVSRSSVNRIKKRNNL